jgi:hypothetical protein
MLRTVIAIVVIIAFASCNNNSKSELAVYRAMNDGLQTSNRVILSSSELIYHSLEDRLNRTDTRERAAIWQPKAAVIKELSETVISYIEQLKNELIDAAGKDKNNKNEYNESDLNAANELFEKKGKGIELLKKLVKYEQDVLSVDSNFNERFKNTIVPITGRFDHTKNDPKEFTNTFFKDIPAIAAMGMLNKFENSIRVTENSLISYCNQESYPTIIHDDFNITPLINLSSTIVQPGDAITITAGIGSFCYQCAPVISVSGKNIKVNDNGIGSYKLK